LAALAGYLKRQQVTVLYNYTVSRLVGHEFDLGSTTLASLTENVILLRRMEYHSRFYRMLSILQMRSSDHERSTREFTIKGQKGITILPESTSFSDAQSAELITMLDDQR
jgi:circadian clock protein KaiC